MAPSAQSERHLGEKLMLQAEPRAVRNYRASKAGSVVGDSDGVTERIHQVVEMVRQRAVKAEKFRENLGVSDGVRSRGMGHKQSGMRGCGCLGGSQLRINQLPLGKPELVLRCTGTTRDVSDDDVLEHEPAISLFRRDDFLNRCPGPALKHKVLQVKLGACTICGGEQAPGCFLDLLPGQSGQIEFLLNDALGMGDLEQVKEDHDYGTMRVEQILLQKVIHDAVRKRERGRRPVDQALRGAFADKDLAQVFGFGKSGKEELFLCTF